MICDAMRYDMIYLLTATG